MCQHTEKVKLTVRMKAATKEIHSISDTLVKGKLALALSNDKVWANGLLGFFEIFQYLEAAIVRSDPNSSLLRFMHYPIMFRGEAFEEDLNYYLGSNWKSTYKRSPFVTNYLNHLQYLESHDPLMLAVYIYHMYTGMVAGANILARKRALMRRLSFFKPSQAGGEAVTSFIVPLDIIRNNIRAHMNNIAECLEEDMKLRMIEESKTVFLLNNDIINSIEGTTEILIKKILITGCGIFAVCASVWAFKRYSAL